jgi:pantoate--beta-alanine ligase
MALLGGATVAAAESAGRAALLAAGFARVDYFTARDPETLAQRDAGPLQGPARLICAAVLGRTRLLDNLAVDPA